MEVCESSFDSCNGKPGHLMGKTCFSKGWVSIGALRPHIARLVQRLPVHNTSGTRASRDVVTTNLVGQTISRPVELLSENNYQLG
jgi:hypothetical protein